MSISTFRSDSLDSHGCDSYPTLFRNEVFALHFVVVARISLRLRLLPDTSAALVSEAVSHQRENKTDL